jgi:hypothetical protein
LSVDGQRWRKTAPLVATLLASWLTGCSHAGMSSGDIVSLGAGDNGKSVSVAVGDEIDLTLQTIGPGQYATPAVSSGAVRFLNVIEVSPPNPGGPRQLYRFKAESSGSATISIPHTGGRQAPFTITLDVH